MPSILCPATHCSDCLWALEHDLQAWGSIEEYCEEVFLNWHSAVTHLPSYVMLINIITSRRTQCIHLIYPSPSLFLSHCAPCSPFPCQRKELEAWNLRMWVQFFSRDLEGVVLLFIYYQLHVVKQSLSNGHISLADKSPQPFPESPTLPTSYSRSPATKKKHVQVVSGGGGDKEQPPMRATGNEGRNQKLKPLQN